MTAKPALPAEPILASTLWTAHLLSKQSAENSVTRPNVPTGISHIDLALRTGLEYGRIHCISGARDDGAGDAAEIAQAFLVTHLLCSAMATAAVIDTSFANALDVRKLHRALVQRLEKGDGGNATRAVEVLDRLRIMKVFDFEGMMESLEEYHNVLEGKQDVASAMPPTQPPPKGTIGDSEDEGEIEFGDEDDEMLDNPSPAPKEHTAPYPIQPSASTSTIPTSPRLLLITNLTPLTAPLLKTNHVQGQALLTSFLRSLAHLSAAHNLCTILLNDILSPFVGNANANTGLMREDSPSIFAACTARPALGRAFAYGLDSHLLVHRRGRKGGQEVDEGDGGDAVHVIEVLHDRCGDRVGRWAAFTVDDDGQVNDVR